MKNNKPGLSWIRYKKDKSGIILVTVILMSIILSIVAIGIMSTYVSQVKSTSSVIQDIKAEQLATGLFYQYHQQQLDGNGTSPASVTMDGRTYSISLTNTNPGGTPNSTNLINVVVSY
ncbi:MAG: hypothetical protein KAJ18_03770 [Candidatus Omnitrophica bacterium]|nr:hypothetical protein [Candidatus Omnitrophota bacterium]